MIRLIEDGGLPHPGRCACCGNHRSDDRKYFWFKYKEKWGQVLLCTNCMAEAALMYDAYVPRKLYDKVVNENAGLSAENTRLELASDRFRLGFDRLVAEFRTSVAVEAESDPVTDEDDDAQRPETDFALGVHSNKSDNATIDGI